MTTVFLLDAYPSGLTIFPVDRYLNRSELGFSRAAWSILGGPMSVVFSLAEALNIAWGVWTNEVHGSVRERLDDATWRRSAPTM